MGNSTQSKIKYQTTDSTIINEQQSTTKSLFTKEKEPIKDSIITEISIIDDGHSIIIENEIINNLNVKKNTKYFLLINTSNYKSAISNQSTNHLIDTIYFHNDQMSNPYQLSINHICQNLNLIDDKDGKFILFVYVAILDIFRQKYKNMENLVLIIVSRNNFNDIDKLLLSLNYLDFNIKVKLFLINDTCQSIQYKNVELIYINCYNDLNDKLFNLFLQD